MAGRPSKYTAELAQRVCVLVAAGNALEVAAEASGVSRSTVGAWMRRRPAFATAVRTARAEAEADLVAQIRRQAKSSWRAAAWMLEHRPELEGAPAAASLEPSSADQFEELDQLAERRAGKGAT